MLSSLSAWAFCLSTLMMKYRKLVEKTWLPQPSSQPVCVCWAVTWPNDVLICLAVGVKLWYWPCKLFIPTSLCVLGCNMAWRRSNMPCCGCEVVVLAFWLLALESTKTLLQHSCHGDDTLVLSSWEVSTPASLFALAGLKQSENQCIRLRQRNRT